MSLTLRFVAHAATCCRLTQDANTRDPAAAKKFAELTEAYEVLSDDAKRKAYDAYGHVVLDESGGTGGYHGGRRTTAQDIFNIFEEAYAFGLQAAVPNATPQQHRWLVWNRSFGGRVNLSRQRGPPRGRDVQVEVTLDLLEAARGCTKTVAWRSPLTGDHALDVHASIALRTSQDAAF